MKHIYCISGLGADEKVFSRLAFPGYQVHHIKWIIPGKNQTIESYARMLVTHIHHSNPILVGLSFGGIICIEIAKLVPVEKIILISSIPSAAHMPLWMRLSGFLRLNKIVPLRSFKLIEPLENYNLGVETKEEREMVHRYRKNVNRQFSNWAIHSLINWKNRSIPQNLYHIHGDKDRIFPIKKLKPHYIVRSGGHFMIMNRADAVNELINIILQHPGPPPMEL